VGHGYIGILYGDGYLGYIFLGEVVLVDRVSVFILGIDHDSGGLCRCTADSADDNAGEYQHGGDYHGDNGGGSDFHTSKHLFLNSWSRTRTLPRQNIKNSAVFFIANGINRIAKL